MKYLYILRGCPGAGKTTIAESLNGSICCADDYFTDANGNYNFDKSKLYENHKKCYALAESYMLNNTEKIIIANTNIEVKDVKKYKNLGEFYGYTVFILTIENWHKNDNVHNVPTDKIIQFEQKLRRSIRLIPSDNK
jgi:predicted kinase